MKHLSMPYASSCRKNPAGNLKARMRAFRGGIAFLFILTFITKNRSIKAHCYLAALD